MIRWQVCISLLMVITGCETLVEVELPTEKPQITVNSIFNADSAVVVNLSKSRVSGTSGSIYEAVGNADVSLYKNHQKIIQMQYLGNGIYRSATVLNEPNSLYGIKVNVSGFEPIEAEILMPKKPVTSSFTAPPFINCDYCSSDSKVSFTLEDPVEDNYYIIRTFLTTPASSKVQIQHEMKNNVGQFRPFGEYGSAMFSDKSFNGKPLQIELEMGINVSKGPSSVLVEVSNISKAYYDYEFTVKKQNQNNPLFGQEYRPVANNIRNGLGIFASYNSVSFSFDVKR